MLKRRGPSIQIWPLTNNLSDQLMAKDIARELQAILARYSREEPSLTYKKNGRSLRGGRRTKGSVKIEVSRHKFPNRGDLGGENFLNIHLPENPSPEIVERVTEAVKSCIGEVMSLRPDAHTKELKMAIKYPGNRKMYVLGVLSAATGQSAETSTLSR